MGGQQAQQVSLMLGSLLGRASRAPKLPPPGISMPRLAVSRIAARQISSKKVAVGDAVAGSVARALPVQAESEAMQWLQKAFPRLFCDKSRIPKGFEAFFPGAKKAGETMAKEQAKRGGNGGKKPGGGEEPPQTSLATLGALGLGAFLLMNMFNESQGGGREINWQEFKYQLLEQGLVERVVVVNSTRCQVYLKRSASLGVIGGQADANSSMNGGTSGPAQSFYYFTVGSAESLERKLEDAQREMGMEPREWIPVKYSSETSAMAVFLSFAPTLLLIGAFLFAARRMGGAGGGPGGIFKVGKANPTIINKEMDVSVKFKDVAGLQEAKTEIMEFVSFLKEPEVFTNLGAKIPKGALLCGPPGTGKTLLAKAMAGEAGVPFLSMSGSDFIEMFVGVGPSRVRDLFEQARENAPCIVFIDEIDAVACARGKGGFSGGNDERENTLNQLLVEMDGFDSSKGVVVLAGTNRADILDPAILRPGRFDRQIAVEKPDIKGRRDIFQVHLKGMQLDTLAPIVSKYMEEGMNFEDATLKAHEEHGVESRNLQDMASENKEEAEEDVSNEDPANTANLLPDLLKDLKIDVAMSKTGVVMSKTEEVSEVKDDQAENGGDEVLNNDKARNPLNYTETEIIDYFAERMAALTPGFAGAEIANICNEAAIIAARNNEPVVGLSSFEKAADRVIGGIEKPNKIMTPLEKRTVAYHEAGHAIVGWFSENASPLLKVTIVPRTSGALGFAQYLPKELNLHTKEQILDMMCMALGGRAAEELTFGRVTTGASDDLNRVTQMAYSIVRIYGMSERIGNVSFPPSENQMEFDKPYSESLAQIMDEEARKIVDDAYERTKALLVERKEELIGVAEKLLEKETLNQDDVVSIVGERPFDSADDYESIISSSWKRKGEEDADATREEDSESTTNGDIAGLGLASKGVNQ